jgi:ABC-type Na+ efflux pump permease subunit
MRKTLVIAAREYQAAVKTKAFLIGLLVLPIMMGGSILVQHLLRDKVDTTTKHFAVVDRTPGRSLAAVLELAARERNAKGVFDPQTGKQVKPEFLLENVAPSAAKPEAVARQRYELSERVRRKEIFGFVEIGADVLTPAPAGTAPGGPAPEAHALRYQSNSPTYDAFYRWAEQVVNETVRRRRGAQFKLTTEQLAGLLQPVPLQTKALSTRDPKTGAIVDGGDENPLASLLMPGGLMMLMFMMILLGSTPLMQSVVEEKMQRIAEVLLGSVRPFQLMLGKLIGMVGVSLTMAAVYLGAAYWAAWRYGLLEYLSAEVLAWFGLYLVLAVLMYGSLFIAVGAACTDMRETQAMVWPVMLLATWPLFIWFNVLREPNSAFSLGVSLVPFATPMLMVGRVAVPPGLPAWQPALGAALVLLTTLLCVYAAGRIFRAGILMQGKGARLGELLRWVIRG